ncbi:PEP-CTERM sorting domain-containing protein [Microseira wollei]|uniref:Ice-binding protein C-terminal domain-containing protein n=1 Tax=Microseira wollei NIES-4236 TaxID=2530354 RepID=A0AAV3X7L3_9CYAN|nr:PEP-CTERM sorting domain-containing protein [Microseira wollei]GET35352.1 hypothetical protein MiSe_00940 [Microseira wollei NIES-4236]
MKNFLAMMFVLVGLTIPQEAKAITIVDSLGQATPSTRFSVFGSAGLAISPTQFVGPEFVLTQPTILTEIGGFVNNCGTIILGQPDCPNTLPFTVQIHSSLNGVPDLSNTIKNFTLSHDNDPLVISYESVALNLLLEPGVYFALFAPQGSDSGFLLENISNPPYRGELVTIGGFNFVGSGAFVDERRTSAVRILGVPSSQPTSVPEPSTLALIGTGFVSLLSHNRSRRKRT